MLAAIRGDTGLADRPRHLSDSSTPWYRRCCEASCVLALHISHASSTKCIVSHASIEELTRAASNASWCWRLPYAPGILRTVGWTMTAKMKIAISMLEQESRGMVLFACNALPIMPCQNQARSLSGVTTPATAWLLCDVPKH